MTKAELHALAAVGMAAKLKAIEGQLVEAFKMFPDLFLSASSVQLLRPELRNGHAKHWPIAASNGTPSKGRQQTTSARVVAYLQAHGPTRTRDLVRAIGSTHAAVDSVLGRQLEAGTIKRVSLGVYAATGALPPPHKKRGRPAKAKRRPKAERRAASGKLLDTLANAGKPLSAHDLGEASGVTTKSIGSLVRRGYVKRTTRGYVRTAKAFVVEASR